MTTKKPTGCLCEKIPEKEFDKQPELSEDWEVLCRKNGYVYIGYRRKNKEESK